MESKDLVESLKWWTADRFKSLQRKLTTAANTIRKDALSRELYPFLSDNEIETLKKASDILTSVKSKVEHAKEIQARKELERRRKLDSCKAQRRKLVEANLHQEGRELLLFRLAIGLHHNKYSGTYFAENHFVITTLQRVVDPTHRFKIDSLYRECRNDLNEWLIDGSVLWPYDESPDADKLEALLANYREKWRSDVLSVYKDDIKLHDQFIAISQADNVVRLGTP